MRGCGQAHEAIVEFHDPRASRRGITHRAFGAQLPAQQCAKLVQPRRDQRDVARLHDFPTAGAFHSKRIGAGEQGFVIDAFKRAGSAEPKALADAIRATSITDNVSTGPGIQFDAKGQNDKLKNAGIQNRAGKLVTVAPKGATNAKAEWPMKPYDKR